MNALPPEGPDAVIAKVLSHAPDWLRREIASADPRAREQAEAALAAMLSAALRREGE